MFSIKTNEKGKTSQPVEIYLSLNLDEIMYICNEKQ